MRINAFHIMLIDVLLHNKNDDDEPFCRDYIADYNGSGMLESGNMKPDRMITGSINH
jgi:hypothetical protein